MSIQRDAQSGNEPVGVVAGGHTDSPMALSVIAAPLILVAGGNRQEIPPDSLMDAQCAVSFRAWCEALGQPLEFDLCHLLQWQINVSWVVLSLIARLAVPYSVRTSDEGCARDLFEAVLGLIPDAADIRRCQNAIDAAIYAAALTHADAIPLAAERLAARLNDQGIRGYTVAALVKSIKQAVSNLGQSPAVNEDLLLLVRDIFPEAPVGDNIMVPPGWQMSAAGIQRAGTDDLVIPAAVVINRRLSNVRTGAMHMSIAWARNQDWVSRDVPRTVIANARSITELAEFDVPVTSNNASVLVQYLSDFETANFEELPLLEVTDQLGWHGGQPPDRFLLGEQDVCAPGSANANTETRSIRFLGGDEGDKQLVAGYHCAGSLREWQNAIAPLGPFSVIALACYASLTAPMLRLLESPNFVLSFAGATSHGKTTTLRITASHWGRPDEKHPASAIGTWDSTLVFNERAMAVRRDTPFILDDTKLAKRPQDVTQVIYDAVSGREKGRGSLTGTRETRVWNTVLIITGESPSTTFAEAGGTRARVLEIWGSPFGSVSVEVARLISATSAGISRNYGHAGLQFVEYLLACRENWDHIRCVYQEIRAEFQARAGNNGVALRMSDHFAAIQVTAILAHDAGIFPWPYRDVIGELWPVLTADSLDADRAAVALRFVMSWAYSHRAEFSKFNLHHQTEPHVGWAGRWGDGDTFVGFLPHKIDEVLRLGNFDVEATRRMWRDRNWLLLTPEKNVYRYRMISGGPVVSLVAITRAAIIEVMGADDELAAGGDPTGPFTQRPTVGHRSTNGTGGEQPGNNSGTA